MPSFQPTFPSQPKIRNKKKEENKIKIDCSLKDMHKQTLTVIIKSDCNGSRNDKNNSKP